MLRQRFGILVVSSVVIACEGSEGESTSETGASTSTTVYDPTMDEPGLHFHYDIWPIILGNCSCHIYPDTSMTPGVSPSLFLGTDVDAAYDLLIDQPSGFGLDHVEPGDSAASFLYHKLDGTQMDVGDFGDVMPPGAPLTAADLATIKMWIDEGAAF